MKVKTPRERRKSSRKKILFMSLLIVFLMVSSILALWKGDDEQTNYEYNGYEFIKSEQGWVTYVKDQYILFDYGPQELINITLPVEDINLGNKVYLAYRPGDKDTNLDYVLNRLYSVLTLLKVRPVISCYSEENCPDIPIVDCNSTDTVFKIVKLNETKIYKENNCLVLQGDNIELNKIANKVSLVLLGIE